MNSKIKDLCRCALFSAIICICSMITIPTSPIPVNLALFGVLLTALIQPMKSALVSTAVFIAMGSLGLPVFAGLQGGIGVLAGPTGGFIIGYLPCVILTCLISGNKKSPLQKIAGVMAGCTLCYICGSVWYAYAAGTDISAAFALCILPFLPADTVKAASAFMISKRIKKGLTMK